MDLGVNLKLVNISWRLHWCNYHHLWL